jgi:hypothetical protein
MDRRRIWVSYVERDFLGEYRTLYGGPIDECPSLAVIERPILAAVGGGETRGVIVRDGRFPADKGACRWSWWIADDGRD